MSGEVRLGIDVACTAAHQASLADARGVFLWQGWRFRTTTTDLERLWAKIPGGTRVVVVMEPTRNAWAPLAAWFEARGAVVSVVPLEQSADPFLLQVHDSRPWGDSPSSYVTRPLRGLASRR